MLTEKKSAVIVQGVLTEPFFDFLVRRNPKDVVVMEGRPGLQALDVNCQALLERNVTPIVIADNMAGFLFARNLVKEVWMASRNSDSAGVLCEIGALVLAVLARRHKVPVYCFPTTGATTFLGKPGDLFKFRDVRVAASGVKAYVPLWEWVPRKYVRKVYE